MRIEALKDERLEDFVRYCMKYRSEIDDSFLYDEDLKDFEANYSNPTYIIVDHNEQVIASASLIIDDYHKRGRKGRFRIFYSEVQDLECYHMLMKAILNHTDGLDKVFVFVPMENKKLMEFVEKLELTVERYSFFLLREDLDVPDFQLLENYEIRPFKAGSDEKAWCEVRNPAFAKLQGSETPITPEMVEKMISSDGYIEGAAMIMYHKEKAVGVIRGELDEYEGSQTMNIGPIAIIPEYQGKGLGRCLLRALLGFAKEKNYKRTTLCVNAENERAKALYLQEGFKQVQAVTCYKYDLTL